MKKRIVIVCLACLLMLTGCCRVGSTARYLAEKMNVSNAETNADMPQSEAAVSNAANVSPSAEPTAIALSSSVTRIRTAADFEKLRSNPSGNFVLAADITLGSSFESIDTFSGTLDGQGYSICLMKSDPGYNINGALFYSIEENAVICNLNAEITIVSGHAAVPAVYGFCSYNGGSIRDCTITSTISGADSYAPMFSNGGEIKNCTLITNAVNVRLVNGVASENSCPLRGNIVKITADGCRGISGIAYRNWDTVKNCNVSVSAAGISGFECVASQNYASVQYCTFTANLTPSAGETVVWYDNADSNIDSTNTCNVSCGRSWNTSGSDSRSGSGTKSDPYRLRYADDLEKMRNYPSAYFILANDIDYCGNTFYSISEFNGVLDGNGYTISGIEYGFTYNSTTDADVASLFRVLNGTVKNLTLSCSMDAGDLEKTDTAGLTIRNNGTISNCSITVQAFCCYAFGGITRNNTASGKIENCVANVSAYGCNYIGGIAEYQQGTVADCSADVGVYKCLCIGGISYANFGTIKNCFTSGTLWSQYTNGYKASIAGENHNGKITSCSGMIYSAYGEVLPSVGNE